MLLFTMGGASLFLALRGVVKYKNTNRNTRGTATAGEVIHFDSAPVSIFLICCWKLKDGRWRNKVYISVLPSMREERG